jgi:hypothetical protein
VPAKQTGLNREKGQKTKKLLAMAIDLIRTKAAHRDDRSAVLMKTIGTLLFTLILRKKGEGKKFKKLLAMTIDSDTNQGGASRRAISRTHENDRNPSFYSYFERFLRPALRGDGLPVQRDGGKCAGFA